jgi:hypothetical protein
MPADCRSPGPETAEAHETYGQCLQPESQQYPRRARYPAVSTVSPERGST